MYRVPLQQLKLNYTVSTTNKKVYTEEEDRFLLVMLDRYGVDGEGSVREDPRRDPRVALCSASTGSSSAARRRSLAGAARRSSRP